MDVRSPFFQNVATVLVGVMFLNPIVGAAADLTVAVGSGATVGQARNGVPVVNIAAPNGNGLSHNKFKDYNVGQQGLILNNATSNTQATQLGGIILGNPNLKGRAASLILNEVTGANASRLQGYTEVAGKSAHVVVANPHGITCDGCGFINTPRVTLSTGTPMIESGRLDRFDVNGGSIAIEGMGLNASNVDQFDLITRSATINAELHANKLNIITGRNEVKSGDLSVTAKTPEGSDQPLLAIDSSALGGMYAGAIRLVGTEAGVGVKLAGDMAASAGDIQIDANGQLSMGRAAAARDVSLKAQAIELEQATYAGRDARIDAEGLSSQVSLATGGDLNITARQINNAQGAILEAGIRADGSTNAAATLTVTGERLDNTGDIVAHGALNTDLKSLNNRATVLATGKASINAATLDNQGGTLIGQQALKITGDQLNNRAGTVASNGALDVILSGDLDNRDEGILLSKGGNLNAAAQTLNNQNGTVQADNGTLTIAATTLNNTTGNIGAAQGALNLDAATIHNQGGNLQGITVTLTGQTLNNGGSVIASTGQAQLTVDTLNNANGTLLAATDLSITAIDLSNDSGKVGANAVDLNLSGKLDNNNGLIESATTLGVTAEQASNIKGKLRALGSSGHSQFSLGRLFDNTTGLVEIGNSAFTLDVPSLKNQGGTVRHLGTVGLNIGMDNLGGAGGSFMTNSRLELAADEWTNISQIQAALLDLDIKRLTQANTGALLAIDSLNLAGNHWINDGRIETDGGLALTLAGDYSGNGALLAQDDLTLSAASINIGQHGELRSGGVGIFTAAQAFNNAGVITATTGLELNAASVLNQGTLGSAEELRIATSSLNNVGGLIFSGADMSLFANELINRKGDIYSLGNLLVAANTAGDKASRFSNLSGTVESAGWMSVAASLLENARETLDISSSKYAARLYYVGCTDCSGTNEDGLFRLEEIDRTTATNVSAQAQLLARGDMRLVSDALSNRYSLMASGGDLRIDTNLFNNQGAQTGTVLTSRQLKTHRVKAYAVEYQKEDANAFTNLHWHTSPNFTSANIARDLNAFINKHVEYTRETYAPVLSDVVYYHATVQAAGDVTINASQQLNNSVINPSFAYVNGGTRNPDTTTPGTSISTQITFNPQLSPDLAQQVVDPLALPGFSLPQGQNGMFHFNPSGSHNYLIETNPAFASLKSFLSSDYMLGLLGYDMDATQKRLGDGFYEQRLIREAIVDRTGQRYLAGLTSDEAMFRYLMDNAIVSKDALGLSLGVSLTAEQVAALTHDIVWMEEREVMGEKVLVPMLYLAQAGGRLAPTGALIQGQDVALISGSSLNNQGTLRASQNLDVTASNITNSGLMQANERLQLLATDSIRNAAGGIIAGRDVTAVALTGDIINERSITTHEATLGSRYQDRQDFADNAARIEAGNDLQLSAGRDMLNVGGVLSAGGDASLSAGRDLVVASQQEEDAYARKDRKSQTNQQVITQHASEVNIGGDLTMQADRDLAVIGSRVEAGGDMALGAGENLTIASAANESHYEHHRKSGGKKVDIIRDNVTQQSAELVAGGNLAVQSGKNTSLVASSVKVGEEAYFYAGGDISLLAAADQSYSYYYKKKKSGGLISSKKTTLSEMSNSQAVASFIQAGADLTLVANNDLTLEGAKLSSNKAIVAYAGHDIVLDAAENSASQASGSSKSRLFSSKASTKSSESTTLTSSSLSGKSVELLADNDILLRAAAVHAEEGIVLNAGRDVLISTAQQSQQANQASKSSKLNWHLTDSLATNGSFTLENKAKGGEQRTVQEVGSTLSGGTIDIDSGRDTAIRGSTLVADGDIRINAARHLTVGSAETSHASSASSKTKNMGEIGNWYQGATGVASLKETNTNNSATQTASQIASLGGDVALTAGERYKQVASHVIAPAGDINIVAKQVDIEAGYDRLSATQKQSSSRTAVGGAVSVPLVDAVRNIQQMSDAAGDTGDTRLKTLAAVNTAMNAQRGYEAAQAIGNGNLTGIKVSVNLSNSKGSSSSSQSGQNVVGSTIVAGGNVNISAVGDGKNSNLNVVGSQIEAVHNVSLKAGGDINLLAAQNTAQQRGDNANSGWSVGVGFGLGSQNGFTLDLAANKGKGYSDGESVTHSNTAVRAGETVKIVSGEDTNLKGAVVSANQVQAEVGGDLNLASQQDIDNHKSEQKDASVGISVCIPPFCYGVSGSAAFGRQKIDSSYASVVEQTGIKAGDGGFQVDVKGNTDLKGAVIASTDKAVADGKNSLITGTLTHSDIKNKAEYDATSLNLSGGFSIGRDDGGESGATLGKDQDGNISTAGGGAQPPSINGVSASTPIALSTSGEDSSTTRSGISAGTIVITDEAKQKELTGQSADQAVADINREVSSQKDGSSALGKIFDREEVEAGFEITRQFVQNVGSFLEDRARQADAARAAAEAAEAKSRDPELTDEQRQVYRDQAIALQEQAQAINKSWGAGSPYRQIATALVAAASGNVTGANGEFVRSMVVNYVQQQGAGYIGDLVAKGELTEGSPIHAALHAIVGCAGAAASQQSCSAGALGGAASSVLAGLFDETSPDETAEQREAKRNIITSLVTGIAALREPGDATAASGAATANVDNNWLATQQKVQRDKELAQATSLAEELAVLGKWSRIDLGQDVDTSVGLAKGLKDGLAGTGLDTLNGLTNFMRDPVEQWDNLAKLASTDAIKQALGDGYEAFQAEVALVQSQFSTGGGENAEALGYRIGSIFAVVIAAVSTGGASTARAGQVLDDIGIVVHSSKTAQVVSASKGKTLTYLERLKRDGHDSDVPVLADGTKGTGQALREVEVSSGGKGSWAKELNKPEPNTIYKVDGNKTYQTDSLGRVDKVESTLSLSKNDRNTYQQCVAGKCGVSGDEGGHLIASVFNGPGERLNLLPMNGNLNKGAWKAMENTWASALKQGQTVGVKIEPVYSGSSVRPDRFTVRYSIDGGRPVIVDFKNSPGGI